MISDGIFTLFAESDQPPDLPHSGHRQKPTEGAASGNADANAQRRGNHGCPR